MNVDGINEGRTLLNHGQGDASVYLRGSSFPLGIPPGSLVSQLALEVPTGLQATSFFVREIYGGKRLERMALVLFYERGGERVGIDIARPQNSPSVVDTEQFNPFVLCRDGVTVSNFETKTRYIDERMKELTGPEPGWTVKTVSPDAILRYICTQISLEELDQAAKSEQQARDELAETKAELDKYRSYYEQQYERAERAERALRRLAQLVEPIFQNHFVRFCAEYRNPGQTKILLSILRGWKNGSELMPLLLPIED